MYRCPSKRQLFEGREIKSFEERTVIALENISDILRDIERGGKRW